MKKIAILHYAYYPNVGGVENVVSDQAQILYEMGYDVSVVTGFGHQNNSDIKVVVEETFQAIVNYNPKLQEEIMNADYKNEQFINLSNKIYEKLELLLEEFPIIIIHNMLTLIHNLPFVHAFRRYEQLHDTKKYIIWIHDHKGIDEQKIVFEQLHLHDWQKELLIKPLNNSYYVVVSDTFLSLLKKIMPIDESRLSVIRNGIDIKKFLKISDAALSFYYNWRLNHSCPVILLPVNIVPRKNLEYSIEIFSKIKLTYPHSKLLITGSTSTHKFTQDYYELLVDKVKVLDLKEDVFFMRDLDLGIKSLDIRDLYAISDIVFYFSKGENFGLPILESGLLRVPIFVSDLQVFHEIGNDDLVYVNISDTSAEETAKIVINFIKNNLQLRINRRVKSEYDLRTIIPEKLVPLLT